jgi:hypothetical protein
LIFKKEIEDRFDALRTNLVRIPNPNSNNPNFFQTSRKFLHLPFFSDRNVLVEKVHPTFGVSKFQILDAAEITNKNYKIKIKTKPQG